MSTRFFNVTYRNIMFCYLSRKLIIYNISIAICISQSCRYVLLIAQVDYNIIIRSRQAR